MIDLTPSEQLRDEVEFFVEKLKSAYGEFYTDIAASIRYGGGKQEMMVESAKRYRDATIAEALNELRGAVEEYEYQIESEFERVVEDRVAKLIENAQKSVRGY